MIDPALAGRSLDRVRFPLDRSKLAELARALHDPDPVWHDLEAATAVGFARVPLPPTATVLADHWRDGGALAPALALGADLGRLLHGEAEWEFVAPICVGDELVADARVADIEQREGRRGGTMTLATLETEFRNGAGEVVVRRRDTLIETSA
jgi:acyl dehydratase